MKLKAHLDKKILVVDDEREIPILCDVRTLANGRRKKDEVIKSVPDGKPIDPRTFPKGIWNVGRPVARTDTYLYPFFIPTDAYQELPIWSLDTHGCYLKATPMKTKDTAYGLHFSSSSTTLGCIRVLNQIDLRWLVEKINTALDKKQKVTIEVV